jgi:septal ring factor EnvC (AmiA/AmiB activator)
MNPIDQLADERDKLKSKLRQAKAKLRRTKAELKRANTRIARMEKAGDDLRVVCESVVSASDVVKYVKRWTEAKEAKP